MSQLPQDLDDIARLPDPVVRNLLITQRYHDLSRALNTAIGGPDVNWATFACWASKTAGESIRAQEVPEFVDEIVGGSQVALARAGAVEVGLRKFVSHLVFGPAQLSNLVAQIIRDVASQIAEGNLAVYAELTPKFAEFCRQFSDPGAPAVPAVQAFIATIKPGAVERGGQELLREAFTALARAKATNDEAVRAREVFLANALIGFHEQTRLQPRIKAALDAPIEDAVVKFMTKTLRAALPDLVEQRVLDQLGPSLTALADEVELIWERVATSQLMELALPGGKRIRLGKSLAPDYPGVLADIKGNNRLVSLMRQFDDGRTGTDDWANLSDRMGFIITLFRNNARNQALFSPPFSDAQQDLIEQRQLPPEELGAL